MRVLLFVLIALAATACKSSSFVEYTDPLYLEDGKENAELNNKK